METLIVLVWIFIAIRLIQSVLNSPRRRPARRRLSGDGPPHVRVDPCLGEVLALPPEPTPGAEDILYVRLLAGAISQDRYRAEMAALAVRDQQAHPVELPPA